jgi:hypothetical protein
MATRLRLSEVFGSAIQAGWPRFKTPAPHFQAIVATMLQSKIAHHYQWLELICRFNLATNWALSTKMPVGAGLIR